MVRLDQMGLAEGIGLGKVNDFRRDGLGDSDFVLEFKLNGRERWVWFEETE